jgi:hemolysin-activating ACP:hemolysin acyltransferase
MFRTKAAFSTNGGATWGFVSWAHSTPNKHEAIIAKARELRASSWDFGQATHAELARFPVSA